MITITIDATAGRVQDILRQITPDRAQPGIGGSTMPEITLNDTEAAAFTAELDERGIFYSTWTTRHTPERGADGQ